ncbi:MAG: DNA replication/repair protein RecF [Oscillospiraceae bacterium]|jgi:DNA replication and repair protein RecF|nr:DNA replication/repair protein RecF [Oscillospiraceae bacterium]
MRVLEHSVRSFRNLHELQFTPSAGVNLICGDNGQGKTNTAESLWLLTGCQSFRTKRLRELIAHGQDAAQIAARVFAGEREQTIEIQLGQRRRAVCNGIALESPHALLGLFPAVIFSPDTLALVREGAGHRRRFLDIAISFRKPAYAAALSKYCKVLDQRNALLRTGGSPKELAPWDGLLAHYGAVLIAARAKYTAALAPLCASIYGDLSGEAETLSLTYQPCVPADELSEYLLLSLFQRTLEADQRAGYTTAGVHAEDFALRLDGRSARVFGSRGQQRCCALALKIAEASLLCKALDDAPVVILDDVMSELDAARQAALLRYLQDWQAFITCCEVPAVFGESDATLFHMREGKLVTE